MKAIELHYRKSGGQGTAFVFLDDDGMVASAKGLAELIQALRRPVGPSAADITAFMDLTKPCPRADWEDLRAAYAQDMQKATEDGCTKCARTAITRRYVHKLNLRNRGLTTGR